MLFASQAAGTRVETSQEGVVVFEAGGGRVAHRIVEGIRTPGSRPEQLLDVLTCRRSDWQEVSLAGCPLGCLLEGAAPLRAARSN